MTTTGVIILVIIIIAVAVALGLYWSYLRRRRSQELRARFGPEYERTFRQYGETAKAEQDLTAREKRLEKVHIRPLTDSEREHFQEQWQRVQAHFVDDPAGTIQEADQLVGDVMNTRGYPVADFERRADDISVDYPHVVSNYRVAHEIALSHQSGKASTEDLRKAVVCYRKLFEELVEAHAAPRR